MKTFRSNGKLLLTGEYLVLHGAVALALPTKLGQTLSVETCHGASLQWEAYKPDGPWFSATLNPESLAVMEADAPFKAERLSQILKAVQDLNPSSFQPGLHFETRLEFDPEWGLGSSSTLLGNLAQWAGVNPYMLMNRTFPGSGYDIACARADGPIFYKIIDHKPGVAKANFNPPFADHLFFVYQGHKQTSSSEVVDFNARFNPEEHQDDMETVSKISLALPHIDDLEQFKNLMLLHEITIARCTGKDMVQEQYHGFNGVLKSLGAWGGDFLLAASAMPFDEVCAYFQEKGLSTIFKYQDLI